MRVKDLLAQQDLQNALREKKVADMAKFNWMEMKDKAIGIIH